MLRNPLQSTHYKSVGWENDTMEIEFVNNQVYQYANVSQAEFEKLQASQFAVLEFVQTVRTKTANRIS